MINLDKELKYPCPCCNKEIAIKIKNGEVESIIHSLAEMSEIETAEVLNKLNIELG